MAEKDLSEKLLEEYDDVFADIVNVLLFNGKREVKEEELTETGTESQYKADDSKLHVQERDVAKYWKNGKYKPSSDVIRHVDAILKFMAVSTGDQRYFNEAIQEKMQTGGIRTMDKILDDYINRGRKEGRLEGRLEERTALIRSLCKKKSPEEVADLLELPVEGILEIIKE